MVSEPEDTVSEPEDMVSEPKDMAAMRLYCHLLGLGLPFHSYLPFPYPHKFRDYKEYVHEEIRDSTVAVFSTDKKLKILNRTK